MLEKIAKKMMELGFTQYEARAYISLLQNYPATRYEISKRSGVPRSAIYDVINRLEKFGAVNAISSKPEKYAPLPPEQFIELLENRYKSKIRDFFESISDIQVDLEMENLWNISGYQNMILKAREMINKARDEIYLSAWNREVEELASELRKAERRGVKVVVFSFTKIPSIGKVFSYELSESELEKVWDHKIILVRDREELLMGEANRHYPRKVAWTHNKAIVMIAANHIVLDITLYGLRAGVDVSDVVIESHPGELELLGNLLREKFSLSPVLKPEKERLDN
ncbi:MAG: TrmB family transcriptional regulator [Calditrichaeota bacterium]|nr:MAG: TrmB family transcriptional regulator [Calditrichota bacterium]